VSRIVPRWSLLALVDASSAGGRLPGPEGVSCARNFAFGAKMPWKRVRWARGGGTSAASVGDQDARERPMAAMPTLPGGTLAVTSFGYTKNQSVGSRTKAGRSPRQVTSASESNRHSAAG